MAIVRKAIIQNQLNLKFSVMGIFAAIAVTLAFLSAPSQVPVSAQITPSLTPETSDSGIGFMAQDSTDKIQNNTSTNITQLAVLPAADQPITPAPFTPVSEETGGSDDSTSSDDDDDSSSSSDNDNDNDDGDDDGGDDSDDGDGGGSGAFAGAGGAFASAG